jgi:MEDS: MEthanogen/methylotroph, DcmR Sensory domain
MRPGDHMGWVFSGADEFAAMARSCLIEGAARGERLMYVADRSDRSAVAALAGVASGDDLRVVDIADVYGTGAVVDPQAQLEFFAAEVDSALADGYSGLRAVGDASMLIASDEALAEWLRWEILADRFIAVNPMTALCGFDTQRVDHKRLGRLAAMHPLSSASGPVPPFRLFFQGSALRLAGTIDAPALTSLRHALADLPAGTPAEVDLGEPMTLSPGVSAMLTELAGGGTPVTVYGQAAALREVAAEVPPRGRGLVLREY